MAGFLQELVRCEELFHRPAIGTPRAEIERMLARDFSEVGAAGKSYDREHAVAVTVQRSQSAVADERLATEYACRALAEDLYLLTYRLQEAGRVSLRSTIWRRDGSGWAAVYHQGTIVP